MLEDILRLDRGAILIADVGAAFCGEVAPYQPLLERGLGKLVAFEPDLRQHDDLKQRLGEAVTLYPYALGDGTKKTLHVCRDGTGMSSLLRPDAAALGFFNLFPQFGTVLDRVEIDTVRLDDLQDLAPIDFLKIDVQGSELSILENGRRKLAQCVFIQTEVSFIPLYESQPGFGEVDIELRGQGLLPHRFANIKQWSIAPTVRDNEPRRPFNQLLEADIVYMRNMVKPAAMSDLQIKKLAAIAHYCYASPDLVVRCLLELQLRSAVGADAVELYLAMVR
ncbi:MAG: FkbM family methyltransferase [Beijerinckiaceae bacterium]